MRFQIREATALDVPQLCELFQTTVLSVNRHDYSQAEVEDWASCGSDNDKWLRMVETHHFVVTIGDNLQMVGFASITTEGYLHSMFVHRDFQQRGIASSLLTEVERYARAQALESITSEVSITARPFFEQHGYVVVVEQRRRANQLYLTNFQMEKIL